MELRKLDPSGRPGELVAETTSPSRGNVLGLDAPFENIKAGDYWLCIEGYAPHRFHLKPAYVTLDSIDLTGDPLKKV
jgi:hypothetical protein